MAIRFHSSALRHGIKEPRAIYVIGIAGYRSTRTGSMSGMSVMFLGVDDRGVPLEVIGVELASGDLLVIYAIRMRRRYRQALERGDA